MNTAARVAQLTVRVVGLLALILGLLFWGGDARQLIPVHMLLGLIVVIALVVLAVAGMMAGRWRHRGGSAALGGRDGTAADAARPESLARAGAAHPARHGRHRLRRGAGQAAGTDRRRPRACALTPWPVRDVGPATSPKRRIAPHAPRDRRQSTPSGGLG